MNIGVIRESGAFDRRVALTPPVARHLVEAGNPVWVETGAGEGAMFRDDEYIRAGAQIAYTPADVMQRAEVLAKIGRPTIEELDRCPKGMTLMAFYHMAVADRGVFHGWWKETSRRSASKSSRRTTGACRCWRRSAKSRAR